MKIISSNIILISLLWIGLVSCGKNAKDKSVDQDTVSVITLISPEDLNSANDNILLIDVRTPNEYASGHIQNSVNIDYRAENFKELIQELDKNQDVYDSSFSLHEYDNSYCDHLQINFQQISLLQKR